MARKTKLTPELQKRFMAAIGVGATHRIACEYVGIDPDTLYEWLKKGYTGKLPYADFAEQLKLASGGAAVGWLAKIEQAANQGNWQAAAWKLERRYPEEFGRTIQQVDVELGEGMAALLKVVSDAHASQ